MPHLIEKAILHQVAHRDVDAEGDICARFADQVAEEQRGAAEDTEINSVDQTCFFRCRDELGGVKGSAVRILHPGECLKAAQPVGKVVLRLEMIGESVAFQRRTDQALRIQRMFPGHLVFGIAQDAVAVVAALHFCHCRIRAGEQRITVFSVLGVQCVADACRDKEIAVIHRDTVFQRSFISADGVHNIRI